MIASRMKKMASQNTPSDMSTRIVRAALNHVPFDGWSDATLQMAADDCGLSAAELASCLPGGVKDAIALYASLADSDMVAAFEALEDKPEKVHLKIRALILCRLAGAMPHKEAVSKSLSYLAQPQNAPLASKLLYGTVDTMWRASGDDATDVSFYTKRATLAAVYSATLLAFLSDDSADMEKTKTFLDRRLRDVAQIPKVTAPAKAAVGKMASLAGGLASALFQGRNRPF